MSRSISPPPLKRRRTEPGVPKSIATQPVRDLSIYAWNVNGIKPFIQKSITSFFKTSASNADGPDLQQASLRDFLRRHSWPTMLLLQEVKIAPTDTSTQHAVEAAVSARKQPGEPDYKAFFTLPTDKYNATGFGRKVYGVCSIVRADFLAAQNAVVRTVDWDAEGRFSIIETEGLNGWPALSIWNIYAVNGTDFDYRDPENGKVVGSRHDRKLAVHQLLTDECQRLERQGYMVILAGDMNVAKDHKDGFPRLRVSPIQHVKNRKDFAEKMFEAESGLQAIDTFRELHPTVRRYTYYPRGVPWGESCDRVDYVLCSKALRTALVDAGMLDDQRERGPSDHCPVFAAFSFSKIDESDSIDRVSKLN